MAHQIAVVAQDYDDLLSVDLYDSFLTLEEVQVKLQDRSMAVWGIQRGADQEHKRGIAQAKWDLRPYTFGSSIGYGASYPPAPPQNLVDALERRKAAWTEYWTPIREKLIAEWGANEREYLVGRLNCTFLTRVPFIVSNEAPDEWAQPGYGL